MLFEKKSKSFSVIGQTGSRARWTRSDVTLVQLGHVVVGTDSPSTWEQTGFTWKVRRASTWVSASSVRLESVLLVARWPPRRRVLAAGELLTSGAALYRGADMRSWPGAECAYVTRRKIEIILLLIIILRIQAEWRFYLFFIFFGDYFDAIWGGQAALESCWERRAGWRVGCRSWRAWWGTRSRRSTWKRCWWVCIYLRGLPQVGVTWEVMGKLTDVAWQQCQVKWAHENTLTVH